MKSALRILAFLVLIASFISLSGIVTTASALLYESTADSCCNVGGGARDFDDSRPCSTPECGCTTCLPADVPAGSQTIQLPLQAESTHGWVPLRFHPQDYIASIDYPPESA